MLRQIGKIVSDRKKCCQKIRIALRGHSALDGIADCLLDFRHICLELA